MSKPIKRFFISRGLALTGLAVWLISLSQAALIIDDGSMKPSIIYGHEILVAGWIGGLGLLTAGWYANVPFFIAGLVLLLSAERPWKTVIVATLLALDTFRMQSIPEGGSVYAYGGGAILWFAAFALLILAVAWRKLELQDRALSLAAIGSPGLVLSMTVVVAGVSLYGVYAYRATNHSSVTESEFLPAGAVKLGPVCTDVVRPPSTKIELSGPLEILGRAYPFDAPASLLAWGIPVVRKNGIDFALSDATDLNSIYWKPADGAVAGVLTLRTAEGSQGRIEAVLTSADSRTTAFRQTWTRNPKKTSLYCPDYRPYDSEPSSPPRSLLAAAVDVPGGLKPPAIGTLKSAITVPPFGLGSLPKAETHGMRADPAAAETPADAGCAPDIRFIDKDPGAWQFGYAGQQTFGIQDRRYFLMNDRTLSAVCAGDSVYLYYFGLDNRKPYLLYIQRREKANFRKVWTLVTGFDYARPEPFKGKRDVRIRSLREEDGTVAAEIVDVEQSLAVNLSFAVPGR